MGPEPEKNRPQSSPEKRSGPVQWQVNENLERRPAEGRNVETDRQKPTEADDEES